MRNPKSGRTSLNKGYGSWVGRGKGVTVSLVKGKSTYVKILAYDCVAFDTSTAYLHDLRDVPIMRSLEASDHVIIDSIDHHEDGFQTLELDFSAETYTPWPEVFDQELKSLPTPHLLQKLRKFSAETNRRADTVYPSPPPTPAAKAKVNSVKKAQPGSDYLQFSGTGIDADPYFCSGILHALPPQCGVPGFQRISMMKVFPPDMSSASPQHASATSASDPFSSSTSSSSNNSFDNTTSLEGLNAASTLPPMVDEACWAYEGVVLPGGMTILGRWWSPADETMDRLGTGPFIFWNVDEV